MRLNVVVKELDNKLTFSVYEIKQGANKRIEHQKEFAFCEIKFPRVEEVLIRSWRCHLSKWWNKLYSFC